MQGLKIHTWRRIVFPTTTASYRKYCDGSWTGLKQAAFVAHEDGSALTVIR